MLRPTWSTTTLLYNELQFIPTTVNRKVITNVLNQKVCHFNGNNIKPGAQAINTLLNQKPICCKMVHKLIMFGDSFLRGSPEIVRTSLSEKCDVLSVVNPGADLSELTQSLKNEVLTLTFMDALVLGGGSNDLDRHKFKTALKLVTKLVKLNNHTNIILLNIPHHYDLQNHSCMNNEIRKYDRKLSERAQAWGSVQ
jgi:hypothetical protein